MQTVLITGAAGMIGSAAVKGIMAEGYAVIGIDRRAYEEELEGYSHYVVELDNKDELKRIIKENGVGRIIHLAALAHSVDGKEYSWDDYYHANVECSINIFEGAGEIPVLFVSTVDVYGFTKGMVDAHTELRPVSHYAKSKAMAEDACRKLAHYTIFRFSPVYTDTNKRDIQKRYYLKYPKIAYQIGKGSEYEILNVKEAVNAMIKWCVDLPNNDIQIIKDRKMMNTTDYIHAEKIAGRAKIVLRIPRWMVRFGYILLKFVTGENKYTYLLNKAVHPLRTK